MEPVSMVVSGLVAGATLAATEGAKSAGKDAWSAIKALFNAEEERTQVAALEANPQDGTAAANLIRLLKNAPPERITAITAALEALKPHLDTPELAKAININLGRIKAKGDVVLKDIATDLGSIALSVPDGVETDGGFELSGIGNLAEKKP